jgi:two-component system NtrC family sensor kinase
MRVLIASKLALSFLFIIVLISTIFIVAGIQLISNRFVAEAQEKVRNDLNAAREIYSNKLNQIKDAIRYTADRTFVRSFLLSGDDPLIVKELTKFREGEGLDVLSITDKYGHIVFRSSNLEVLGDNQGNDGIVQAVLLKREVFASTIIITLDNLLKESPLLAEQAYIKLIDTPLARPRSETEETSGMMLKAAAPVLDAQNRLIGVVYGGVLLNKNYAIVDKIKQTVYQDVMYKGQDVGTATIFQDDVRISTNVINVDGSRAIGTRISEAVYNQVVIDGKPWIGRAYVVNNWYITAYEPITDLYDRIIGILYVGMLEQKYLDIKRQTLTTFLAISLAGVLVTLVVSLYISNKISIPIHKLVTASKEVANGNLDASVKIKTNDELEYLADSFNAMALAIKKRDEQFKEYATQRIMESEKLALVGQLAANVAHELNNPLQGIVAYSHLLLEKVPPSDPIRGSVEKIVGQANRSRDIIRGLLDFSRQRKPEKTRNNVNTILDNCISLLKNQALFQNIQIVEDFQENLPLIVIDPSQIERVFINIIVNSAEAMDGNGQLNLKTHYDPLTKIIEVTFTDTGCGIEKENIDKIFDPFFTTKEVGHGTGLGLAISYGIVKGHGGTISVESEVGKGTSFTIRLPEVAAEETVV